MSIAPILEAIALVANIKNRWPAFNDKTRIFPVPKEWHYRIPTFSPVEYQEDPPISSPLDEEHITLDKCWTGSQYIRLGYGPKSDTLIVSQ